MNKYHLMHKVVRIIPMPSKFRFSCRRAIYDRQFMAEKKLVEALNDAEKLESFHNDWQFEFHMHSEEENEYYSSKLLSRARRLRVLVPRTYEGNALTDDYEVSALTGRTNLTLLGENKVRAAIREEETFRSERWARRLPYVTALTGLIGTIAGLLAVIDKLSR